MKAVIAIFAVFFVLVSCSSDDNNTGPGANHAPVIRSLRADQDTLELRQSTRISFVATDPDGDTLDSFWHANKGSLGGRWDNGTDWRAPDFPGDCWVSLTISDGKEIDTDSVRINVVSLNNHPAIPWDPQPADGQTSVELPVELQWKCSDIDGDAIIYDLFFGSNTPSLIQRNIDTTRFVLENLNSNVRYYWRIRATDSKGDTTSGPTWDFKTR